MDIKVFSGRRYYNKEDEKRNILPNVRDTVENNGRVV